MRNKTIHEKAFIGARIKKLFIPSSFEGFDKYGYINAQIIVFASDNIPDNIVERTAATKNNHTISHDLSSKQRVNHQGNQRRNKFLC